VQTRYTLAADVGGTKTLCELGLLAPDGYRRLARAQLANADFTGVAEVADAFLGSLPQRPPAIAAACFAVAGPVAQQRVRFTNLPWEADAARLGARLGIARVQLVNDFAAIGHGIPRLSADEVLCLQRGQRDAHGVIGVLGAGTGLGMALMVWTEDGYRVVPSEGGKVDFAPVNEVQNRLWSYLSHRLERVGCEALLSGRGLERIYAFLSETDTLRMRPAGAGHELSVSAAEISTWALNGSDPRASSAVNLFLDIYGAVAGNLALTVLAHGGIYIAGGIAPRLAPLFASSGFMRAFCAKGKFAELLRTIPVHVVLAPEVGLQGAVALAAAAAEGGAHA
jgi:glucokinase